MRSAVRFVSSLALGAILAAPLAVTLADDVGRDFSECVQMCRDVGATCDQQCAVDCQELFPNDAVQRKACVTTCRGSCLDQEQDCKARCLAIKRGASPPEP